MTRGHTARRDEPTVIDAKDFEAALNDPRVHKFWAEVDAYTQELIERGHCPKCLIVNCEHMEAGR